MIDQKQMLKYLNLMLIIQEYINDEPSKDTSTFLAKLNILESFSKCTVPEFKLGLKSDTTASLTEKKCI